MPIDSSDTIWLGSSKTIKCSDPNIRNSGSFSETVYIIQQSLAYKNVEVLASGTVPLQAIVLRQNICKAPKETEVLLQTPFKYFLDRVICSIHCLPNFEKIISNFYTNFQAKCGNNNNTQQQLTKYILARAFFSNCHFAPYRGRTLNRVILVGQSAKLYLILLVKSCTFIIF